jgi:hypothetical protein
MAVHLSCQAKNSEPRLHRSGPTFLEDFAIGMSGSRQWLGIGTANARDGSHAARRNSFLWIAGCTQSRATSGQPGVATKHGQPVLAQLRFPGAMRSCCRARCELGCTVTFSSQRAPSFSTEPLVDDRGLSANAPEPISTSAGVRLREKVRDGLRNKNADPREFQRY